MKMNIPCRSIPMPYYSNFSYLNIPFTIEALQNNMWVKFTDGNFTASNITYTKTSNGVTTTGTCGSNISLNEGDTVSFEGPSGLYRSGDYDSYKLYTFSCNGNISMYGNMNSLIGHSRKVLANNFRTLFMNNNYIQDISNLYMDFDEIGDHGCQAMFHTCRNIKTPAHWNVPHIFGEWACGWMHYNNESLTSVIPFEPTGTVAKYAFIAPYGMNNYAPQIVNADYVIPSNLTLNYGSMCWTFEKNTNLKRGPIFGKNYTFGSSDSGSETTFYHYFYNCSNLSAIEVQFTNWATSNGTSVTNEWVYGVQTNNNCVFIVP